MIRNGRKLLTDLQWEAPGATAARFLPRACLSTSNGLFVQLVSSFPRFFPGRGHPKIKTNFICGLQFYKHHNSEKQSYFQEVCQHLKPFSTVISDLLVTLSGNSPCQSPSTSPPRNSSSGFCDSAAFHVILMLFIFFLFSLTLDVCPAKSCPPCFAVLCSKPSLGDFILSLVQPPLAGVADPYLQF